MGLLANVGGLQYVEALRISRHEAVLDSVVHHLDEVTAATRPAVQIALFGSTSELFASCCPRDITNSRGDCFKDRIEVLHRRVRATDHHAVAAIQSPDSSTGTNIDVVNPFRGQFLGPTDIVDVVRVSAVNQDVT